MVCIGGVTDDAIVFLVKSVHCSPRKCDPIAELSGILRCGFQPFRRVPRPIMITMTAPTITATAIIS